MEEISLQELFFIFKKRIGLIIGLTIGALVLSGVVSFFVLTPQYETFTTMMVGKPVDYKSSNQGIEYNDVLLNQKLVHTYGELVKSRIVSDKVIENLNLQIPYDQFQGKIDVSLVNDTEIIKVVARDADNELAADIANEVSDEFMETVKMKMKVENVQIIDRARIPQDPVSPRKFLNMAIGAVLGFMVGVFLTFLLEYLDNTFKTPDDIKNNLDLPVLGSIPEIKSRGRETIVSKNPKSPISEAFRTMRTNIQFTSIDKELKSLAITSSVQEEGKSTIVSNLAISIAQEGKKVIIVDGDLRKPKVHKRFTLPNSSGLTNVLAGSNTLEDVVYNPSNIEGLSVITSGPIPPNPSELLSSKSMKKLLKDLKDKYDMVIIDTPPVGLVTDSAVVSTLVDGTLLVIEAGRPEIGQVQHAKELLDKVDANIIGTVLNKLSLKEGKYGSYKYEQYSMYYGED